MKLDKETFQKDFQKKVLLMFCESVEEASSAEKYLAFGTLIREYLSFDWYETEKQYNKKKEKQVYYFSLEFLIGRLLDTTLINLGIRDVVRDGLSELGVSLADLEELEPDAGLGNGGLGRLAACFLDSMASLGIPGNGVGIRYKYGLFQQQIVSGYQIESPDNWLKIANVWEVRKDEDACIVRFGGECHLEWRDGRGVPVYTGYEPILAVPYDMPVPGYANKTVNTLRLWSAETDGVGFDFKTFSRGDYEKAIEGQYSVAAITNVLYPDDSTERGKMLRLKQEYFLTSAGVQNIVRHVKEIGGSLLELDRYAAIHINDTHPALAIPELLRILMDEEGFCWEEAWSVTNRTMGYTNHTILAEALEKWSVAMFQKLLPRIYMIVEEINRRFCAAVSERYHGDWGKQQAMSILQNGMVKMAHLAIVGSHSVNGVAALHTEILKNQELRNFHEFYPGKFNNKTNGITHRRWLMAANPPLTALLDDTIGEAWKKHPLRLAQLKQYASDPVFTEKLAAVKRENKERLAAYLTRQYGFVPDTASLFDIQVKRLHMYKRQLLNILHVMDLYNRLCDDPGLNVVPRTFLYGAKAFPGYALAKTTIKLINTVAERINQDRRVQEKLKVFFVPNYGVSLAELMIPAGDVSEQISTASKEASGTGNMKFMMNGAVTIATLDGANVEICREVGEDNIVLFGMSSREVIDWEQHGGYCARDLVRQDPRLARLLSQLEEGYFGLASRDEFQPILHHLLEENDPYFTLRDFASYADAQNKVNFLYQDTGCWNRMAAVNIAASGVFSSDNTIRQYAEEIWGVKPVEIR